MARQERAQVSNTSREEEEVSQEFPVEAKEDQTTDEAAEAEQRAKKLDDLMKEIDDLLIDNCEGTTEQQYFDDFVQRGGQ